MSQIGPVRIIDGPNRWQLVHAYLYAYDDKYHTIKVVVEPGVTYELRVLALSHENESGDWHGFEGRTVSVSVKPTDPEAKETELTFPPRELAQGYLDTKRRKGELQFFS